MQQNKKQKKVDVSATNQLLNLVQDKSHAVTRVKGEQPPLLPRNQKEVEEEINALEKINEGLNAEPEMIEPNLPISRESLENLNRLQEKLEGVKHIYEPVEENPEEEKMSEEAPQAEISQEEDEQERLRVLDMSAAVIEEIPPLYMNLNSKTLFAKRIVGLDIGSQTVKTVQLERTSAGFKLISLSIVDIISANPGIDDYEQAKQSSVKKALHNINLKKTKLVCSVGSSDMTIQQFKLPKMTEDELASTVIYEAKRYSHLEADSADLAYQVIKEDQENMEVLLVIIPKESMRRHNDFMALMELNPAITDVSPLALMNVALENLEIESNEGLVLINLGANSSFICIYNEDHEFFLHYIPISGKDFTQKIQLQLNVDFFEGEKIKKTGKNVIETIAPYVNKTIHEIRRTLTFYKNQTGIIKFNQILLTGGNANILNLAQYLASELELKVNILNPFQNIIVNKEVFPDEVLNNISCQLALAVSLARRDDTA